MLDLFSMAIDYLLGQGIQIAAIFAVVWAACFLLRRRSAHLRYLLWLLVIGKCIFPSVVKVSLAVLPEKAQTVAAAEVIEYTPAATAVGVVGEFKNVVYEEMVFAEPSLFDRLGDISLLNWVGIVWGGGVVLFFAVVCFKAWRLNRKLVAMRKPANISEDMPAKVWQIDGIGQPFVWGVVRGSVYLPADFDKFGNERDRRGIIMHEFAHVRRFDAGVNVLQIIAQGIFWFHPLVWVANTMVRREREKCCDEAAIAGLKTVPRDYGKAIVDTLTREYESNMPVPSLAIAGPVKNIEDRIKTIMRPGKKFYGRCGVTAMMIIILLAVVAVPTGLVLTARAETDGDNAIAESKVEKAEVSEPIMFHGFNLSNNEITTPYSKITDLCEQWPVGSNSYIQRIGVDTVYSDKEWAVHYISAKNIFYVNHFTGPSSPRLYGPFEGKPPVINITDAGIERARKGAADLRSGKNIFDSAITPVDENRVVMVTYDVFFIVKTNNMEYLNDPNFVENAKIETQKIVDHIEKNIFPSSETDNDRRGRIKLFGSNKLIVWQVPAVHRKIRAYIEGLQQKSDKAAGRTEVPVKDSGRFGRGMGSGGFGGVGVGIGNSIPKEVSGTGNKKLLIKYRLVMVDSKDIKKFTADGNILTDEKLKSFSGRIKTLHSFSALVYDGTKTSISTKAIESPNDSEKHPSIDISGTMFPRTLPDGKSVFLDIRAFQVFMYGSPICVT